MTDDDWSDEETDNPLYADGRNFYKVEKWTKDDMQIDRLLYAGNNLTKARKIFAKAVNHRPRIRLTIRQRIRVLDQWPRGPGTKAMRASFTIGRRLGCDNNPVVAPFLISALFKTSKRSSTKLFCIELIEA
jgi:hypothetical protein